MTRCAIPCACHGQPHLERQTRRALFRHLNFQNWSENGVLCIFGLGHVFRTTMGCTCSTKVFRPQFLTLLAWKCASRHNGVQLFISHLTSWLCTHRFSKLLFDPPEPQIIGKLGFETFLPVLAPASVSFSAFLFSYLLASALLLSHSSTSAFHLAILLEV